MDLTARRNAYREILEGERCVFPGSVFDPISARIAEDVGFEVMMFAGSIGSATVLGAPDYIILTLTEFAQQIHRICRAGNLPLMVDSDHGYGNALNVKRTVEELETAGVAALTIEDTLLPRAFGSSKPELISIDEGIGKMKAALSGRTDPSLVIAGRTSACGIMGLDEGIRRAKAYQGVGVDALFFAGGINNEKDLEAIRSEIKIPIIIGTGSGALANREYLGSQGVRIALQGHMPFLAAVKATFDTLKALKDGTQPADLTNQPSDTLMDQLTRLSTYDEDIAEYLE